MITRLVIFLVRRKLGLKKYEEFRFVNQKNQKEFYWFEDHVLMKKCLTGYVCESSVSLNWLLNDNCEIVRVE